MLRPRDASAFWASRRSALHQRVPLMLGSRAEVERLVAYHKSYDEGEEPAFQAPLFHKRSLFRSR